MGGFLLDSKIGVLILILLDGRKTKRSDIECIDLASCLRLLFIHPLNGVICYSVSLVSRPLLPLAEQSGCFTLFFFFELLH